MKKILILIIVSLVSCGGGNMPDLKLKAIVPETAKPGKMITLVSEPVLFNNRVFDCKDCRVVVDNQTMESSALNYDSSPPVDLNPDLNAFPKKNVKALPGRMPSSPTAGRVNYISFLAPPCPSGNSCEVMIHLEKFLNMGFKRRLVSNALPLKLTVESSSNETPIGCTKDGDCTNPAQFCDIATNTCKAKPGNEGGGCLAGNQCNAGLVCANDNTCQNPASASVCGNGKIEGGEQCDDGNKMTESCPYGVKSCTVCAADCTNKSGAVSYCGDGKTDAGHGEACDDGNLNENDDCKSNCQRGGIIPPHTISEGGECSSNMDCQHLLVCIEDQITKKKTCRNPPGAGIYDGPCKYGDLCNDPALMCNKQTWLCDDAENVACLPAVCSDEQVCNVKSGQCETKYATYVFSRNKNKLFMAARDLKKNWVYRNSINNSLVVGALSDPVAFYNYTRQTIEVFFITNSVNDKKNRLAFYTYNPNLPPLTVERYGFVDDKNDHELSPEPLTVFQSSVGSLYVFGRDKNDGTLVGYRWDSQGDINLKRDILKIDATLKTRIKSDLKVLSGSSIGVGENPVNHNVEVIIQDDRSHFYDYSLPLPTDNAGQPAKTQIGGKFIISQSNPMVVNENNIPVVYAVATTCDACNDHTLVKWKLNNNKWEETELIPNFQENAFSSYRSLSPYFSSKTILVGDAPDGGVKQYLTDSNDFTVVKEILKGQFYTTNKLVPITTNVGKEVFALTDYTNNKVAHPNRLISVLNYKTISYFGDSNINLEGNPSAISTFIPYLPLMKKLP